MSDAFVKANLNLYAVLRNLEDLPGLDPSVAAAIRTWDISIQFTVMRGPKGYLVFKNGACSFGEGVHPSPDVRLFFTSPAHFNKMMDGKSSPIPLKGLTRLKFLMKDFPKVTDRLEHYLKPDAEKMKDPAYMKINTTFTLNTAVFAVKELAVHDPVGKLNAAHIMNGTVLFDVQPDGPQVFLTFHDGDIFATKGRPDKPLALMQFRDLQSANDLLNNVSDPFTAVAGGDVLLRGRIAMIDAINQILDRVPHYLS
ncbi:hypothetical protein JCM14469_09630 [Desulfatiferula olefinivorans]